MEKLWGLDDPLFPATKVAVGDNRQSAAAGLDRKHWSSAGPIRAIFKEAFTGGPFVLQPVQLQEDASAAGRAEVQNTGGEYKA